MKELAEKRKAEFARMEQEMQELRERLEVTKLEDECIPEIKKIEAIEKLEKLEKLDGIFRGLSK